MLPINLPARGARSSFPTIRRKSANRLICGRRFNTLTPSPLQKGRGAKGEFMIALSSKTITYEQLAKVIDHSLLRPELTEADVIAGCELAARYHTATVCVKPCHVKLAKSVLKDSDVLVSTVIGFPHGSHL